jgi:stage V sporulation protein R
MNLTPELEALRIEIEGYAASYGLDFFDTIFEVLDFEQMNEVASYGGFPTRYPHWRFGMEYENLRKSYTYGLQKIYEMVVNNDPCYAYLLECNNIEDQKIVMAHVYAHSDFFKNNYWFQHTNRKMMDEIANHSTRVIKYIEKYGLDVVEDFISCCLSLETLIDYHSPFIQRKNEKSKYDFQEEEQIEIVKKLPSKDYMDGFINPTEFLEEQKKRLEEEKMKKKKFPEEPTKDVLTFLIENAPLERWQLDILSIIKEESYYFAPQSQTKIMNEGWATYWHSKIMTEKALKDSELINYADHHSSTLANRLGRINPYKIGVELFRYIEDRWNKGRFGKEYDDCNNLTKKKNWDKKLGLGRRKIFEVRKIYNDVGFIDTFFTEDFCNEQKFFTYKFNEQANIYEIASRDFKEIKKQLLFSLTNLGRPFIYVIDGNYGNRGELYLKHRHEGIDLKIDYAQATLTNIYNIWQRPVHIETIVGEKGKILTFDGKEQSEREIKIE